MHPLIVTLDIALQPFYEVLPCRKIFDVLEMKQKPKFEEGDAYDRCEINNAPLIITKFQCFTAGDSVEICPVLVAVEDDVDLLKSTAFLEFVLCSRNNL